MMKTISYSCAKLFYQCSDVIPTKTYNTFSKHIVPGWNELVRESHQAAKESFLVWRSAGNPRHVPLYDLIEIKILYEKVLNIIKLND